MSGEQKIIYCSVMPDKIDQKNLYELSIAFFEEELYLGCKYYFNNIEAARLSALYNQISYNLFQHLLALFSGELLLKELTFERASLRISVAAELFSKMFGRDISFTPN